MLPLAIGCCLGDTVAELVGADRQRGIFLKYFLKRWRHRVTVTEGCSNSNPNP